MPEGEITLTDRLPRPPAADLVFEIDFQKGVGSASRVFAATYDFIKTCEMIDAELVRSIDSSIETVLVLEDIQEGSIKTFLRNHLESTDDQALKALDWKKLVGEYLVRAKYAILRFTDDATEDKSLPDLRKEIQKIASDTDIRHIPDYAPPSPKALVEAIGNFQSIKDTLSRGDRVRVLSGLPGLSDYEVNLSVRIPVETIESLAVARSIVSPSYEMILPVKKPDYLGDSRWSLRHGSRNIEAKIEDADWLHRFQSRQVDVRPGDSLRCRVSIECLYGHDNELMSERYTVVNVLEVLVDRYDHSQGDLLR